MKPVIVYVDYDVNQLKKFVESVPSSWEVHTFYDPLLALDQIHSLSPWIILSEQRLNGMLGINFLSLTLKLCPLSMRALITEISDESLVIDAVRKAHVFDYFKKPWENDKLELRIQKMIEMYVQNKSLYNKIEVLEYQNSELTKNNMNIADLKDKIELTRRELEAWAPPFVNSYQAELKANYTSKVNLAAIAIHINNFTELSKIEVQGVPANNYILQKFSELVMKHNGWREMRSDFSACAYFGLANDNERISNDISCEAASALTTEFRVFLRNFRNLYKIEVAVGVGLHIVNDCLLRVHSIQKLYKEKAVFHKIFDLISPDMNLLFKLEHLTHQLPGSNVLMSETFLNFIKSPPSKLIDLGRFLFDGQSSPLKIFLKANEKVSEEDLTHLKGQVHLGAVFEPKRVVSKIV